MNKNTLDQAAALLRERNEPGLFKLALEYAREVFHPNDEWVTISVFSHFVVIAHGPPYRAPKVDAYRTSDFGEAFKRVVRLRLRNGENVQTDELFKDFLEEYRYNK